MAQIDELLRLVRRVLGPDAIGAYLHGSAVLGQLRPHSDTDLFVVTRRSIGLATRRELVDGIMEISGSRARTGPARPVELTIAVQSDAEEQRAAGADAAAIEPGRFSAAVY